MIHAASPSKPRPFRAFVGVWGFLRPYSGLLAAAIVSMLLTVAITLTLPLVARVLVARFETPDPALPNAHFFIAGGIALVAALGFGIRFYLIKLLGELTVADVRKAIFARMIEMSPAFYEKMMTGEVISRITSDTAILLNVIGWSLAAALRHALVVLGALAMLAATSLKLTLMVFALVPLVLVPIVLLGRRLRAQSVISQELIAASAGSASESLAAAQTVQAYTNEPLRIGIFDGLFDRAFHAARQVIQAHVAMNGAVIFLSLAGVITVIWVGAIDVRSGAMGLGDLVQFILYAIFLAEAANGLTNTWGEIQRGAGAVERIVDLLDAEDTVQDPSPGAETRITGRARGQIAFQDVRFSYPSRPESAALDGLDLRIEPGETVALVGPSGAGKSTVYQMLLRFFDPDEGRVMLDGVDLRDMSRAAFRRQIALVPQDPVIFAASARDNIRFGHSAAGQDAVEAAAVAAAAHDFLSDLPDGYDTFLGERGVMLSGGQKQRIAIARAILRDAPVLLLDEATSALDADSEQLVQAAMERLSRDRTTLVIAHRLSTVKTADRIVVFEAGRIVEEGRHDDLLRRGGRYARLAQLQFSEDGSRP